MSLKYIWRWGEIVTGCQKQIWLKHLMTLGGLRSLDRLMTNQQITWTRGSWGAGKKIWLASRQRESCRCTRAIQVGSTTNWLCFVPNKAVECTFPKKGRRPTEDLKESGLQQSDGSRQAWQAFQILIQKDLDIDLFL